MSIIIYFKIVLSRYTVGIPHSFIIFTGLFPDPHTAPSNVIKSISASEEIFIILIKSFGSNGPVFIIYYIFENKSIY